MEAIRTAYQLRVVEAERSKSSTENSQDSTIPNDDDEEGDFMFLAMVYVLLP
jgi:hypothetical protein